MPLGALTCILRGRTRRRATTRRAPIGLKERFLTSIRETATNVETDVGAVRVEEGQWLPSPVPGITYKPLYLDRTTGLLTMLVRMEPGAAYPVHRHSKSEQCLILEGDVIHDEEVYGPGDFTWANAGSLHPPLRTNKGNLLLIIAGRLQGRTLKLQLPRLPARGCILIQALPDC